MFSIFSIFSLYVYLAAPLMLIHAVRLLLQLRLQFPFYYEGNFSEKNQRPFNLHEDRHLWSVACHTLLQTA